MVGGPETQASLDRHNFTPVDEPAEVNAGPVPASDMDWSGTRDGDWKRELLVLFLKNQIQVAPTMPILTLMLAFTSLMWVGPFTVFGWLVFLFPQAARHR